MKLSFGEAARPCIKTSHLFCSATSEAFWARFAIVVAEAAQGHLVIAGLGEGMSRSLRPWEILYPVAEVLREGFNATHRTGFLW